MRIFSFIPAFFLLVLSFVAAAAIAPTTTAVTCAAESGNAAVLQCLTDAVKNATEQLQPLKDKLTGMFVAVVFSYYLTDHHPASGNSGTPDVDTVNQIGTILSTVTAQLQGVRPTDFAGLDIGGLIGALLDVGAFVKP